MTDKPDTPRLVRVSKAPPPIVPINTKRNESPDLPPAPPPPNWGKWAYMRDIELWEAVALSLNLEPDKLPVYLGAYERFGDDAFRICPPPLLDRLQVANSNCGIGFAFKFVHKLRARCLVDLPEFAAWAVKQNIRDLPPELVAMAEIMPVVPIQPQATTASLAPAVVTSSKHTTKRRTWRDVALPSVVDIFKAGNFTTAKALYLAIEKKAGTDSPFERGTGDNRAKLVVRELSETVSLKTIQNAWADIKALR